MRTFYRSSGFGGKSLGAQVTPGIRWLLIANAVAFLITVAVGRELIFDLFAFSPTRLLYRPWGVVTYMFMHAGLWHLLMNLVVIFFFGPPLESRWGTSLFFKYFLACGLGGVLLSFAFADASIVGASAACYGILLAFAIYWPNAPIHIWGIVPVKAKWFVGFLAALSFVSAIGNANDGVAHLAHLGGVIAGFLLLKSGWLPAGGQYGTGSYGRSVGGYGTVGTTARTGGQRRRNDIVDWLRKMAEGAGHTKAKPPNVGTRAPRRTSTTRGDVHTHRSPTRTASQAARDAAELDVVDAVLDKISTHGIGSLTPEERAVLERASRRSRAN